MTGDNERTNSWYPCCCSANASKSFANAGEEPSVVVNDVKADQGKSAVITLQTEAYGDMIEMGIQIQLK